MVEINYVGKAGGDYFNTTRQLSNTTYIISNFTIGEDKVNLWTFGVFGIDYEEYGLGSTKLKLDNNNRIIFEGVAPKQLVGSDFYQSQFSLVGQSVQLISMNPYGEEFQVYENSEKNQFKPSVKRSANGGFDISWYSEWLNSTADGTYTQEFNQFGEKIGNDFWVDSSIRSGQHKTSQTFLLNGKYVIARDNSNDIYAQIYFQNGSEYGNEFQVNSYTDSAQKNPWVTALPDGGFAVTWQSWRNPGGYNIYAQLYNEDGNRFGNEFEVNTHVPAAQELPSISNLTNGGLAVAWQSTSNSGDLYSVKAQIYHGNYNITGDGLNNILVGSNGDDLLSGLSGADYIDGREGIDTVVYSNSTEGVSVNLATGTGKKGDAEGDILVNIENLVGTDYDDILQGVQNNSRLTGEGGADIFVVGRSLDGNVKTTITDFTSSEDYLNLLAYPLPLKLTIEESQFNTTILHVDANNQVIFEGVNRANLFNSDSLQAKSILVGDKIEHISTKENVKTSLNVDSSPYQQGANIVPIYNGNIFVSAQVIGNTVSSGVNWDVYGQLLGNSLIQLDSKFRVNTYLEYAQRNPKGVVLTSGDLVSVWESNWQDSSGWGVFYQLLDIHGNRISDELRANGQILSSQDHPSIAPIASGGFVIIWQESYSRASSSFFNKFAGTSSGVSGQCFDANGNKVGGQFIIESSSSAIDRYPSVAAFSDGSFIVVYHSKIWNGGNEEIFAQRYNPQCEAIGSKFQINDYTENDQLNPSVISFVDDSYMINWHSLSPESGQWQVLAQRYDSSNNKDGEEFRINDCIADTNWPVPMVAMPDNGFATAHNSMCGNPREWGIFIRRFDKDNQLKNDFFLSSIFGNYYDNAAIAVTREGNFVVGCRGGMNRGVNFQKFQDSYKITSETNNGLISGSEGNDVLISKAVNNTMIGGGGADSFEIYLQYSPSVTIIRDYSKAKGDIIRFIGFSGEAEIVAGEFGAEIILNQNNTVIVTGAIPSQIDV